MGLEVLISVDCLRQAISKSATYVEASSFPSVFKEGWLRLNKKIPFLSGADGREARARQGEALIMVGNFKQNKERYAGI
jgi:hypothetical protein